LSKLSKLLRNPGLFARDLLIKLYPFDFGGNIHAASESQPPDLLRIRFPVDVVYTWVDPADPEWEAERTKWMDEERSLGLAEDPADVARFSNHDELRFSLRSLHDYAPWVNHIYLVTAGQRPEWLREDAPGITVVPHDVIIPKRHLPTFNSHVIEAHLHHIPGLQEHFVYLNDDVMLARPLDAGHFFTGAGASRLSLSGEMIADGREQGGEKTMDCASRNTRNLLAERFGVTIEKQILHSFHALRKTSLARCAEILEDADLVFYDQRFRSDRDFNIASLMSHYVGYLESQAVPSRSSCMHFSIHSAGAQFCYEAMLSLKGREGCPDTLCVNDVVSSRRSPPEPLAAFLRDYYPKPHPAER